MKVIFRLAQKKELPVLREIYLAGMRSLHAHGIPQWSDEYPANHIDYDIEAGELFVIDFERMTVGAIVINRHKDSWLDPIPFTPANAFYVHRLVVNPTMHRKGIAKQAMSFAESYVRSHGGEAIRLDTNILNYNAIHLYHSLGYQECGIFGEFGGKYMAYELIL